mmetsp:Transcript_7706/g.14236  ORF Transcript_7706/g.14236 Transcript_7706/m.14236 type:complete len:626 (+) Transcript_7706:65-1942(+)
MAAQSSFLALSEQSRQNSWSRSRVLVVAGAVLAAAGSCFYFSTRILPWLTLKDGKIVVVTAGPFKGKRGVCYGVNADGLVRVLLDGGRCIICISKDSLRVTAGEADPQARLRDLTTELAAGPAQGQLRLVVAGLMGSGKSTLCRMLAHLLGGVWINQDEFSSKGKGAKKAFLAEIKRVAADTTIPVLIVDKINTMRQHRADILESMQCERHGSVVFVQLAHPKDTAGSFKNQSQLCISRIQGRGQNHRTLMGNDPKLKQILGMTVKGAEPMEDDEMKRFSANFIVDMTLPAKKALMTVLYQLGNSGFLSSFDVEAVARQSRLSEAFSFNQTAEAKLKVAKEIPKTEEKAPEDGAKQNKKKAKKNKQASEVDGHQDAEKPKGKQKKQEDGQMQKAKQKKQALLWAVDLDSESSDAVRALWDDRAGSAPSLEVQKEFHCTLLFVGGKSDEEIASQHLHVQQHAEVTRLREELEGREGEEVEFLLSCIVWDDRIAAASASGLDGMCLNRYAHVTIAHREDTPPVKSNELLARRAANADLAAGLGHWLHHLGLQKHHDVIKAWCERSGVTTADEITKRAAEVAEALENEDTDERARIEETLVKAASGEICEASVDIKVRGKLHGWGKSK